MLRHGMRRCAMSCDTTPYSAATHDVTQCNGIIYCNATLHHATPCHATPCHNMPQYTVLCAAHGAMSYDAI